MSRPGAPQAGAVPAAPRYGSASLADLTPSLFAALGVPGFEDVLGFEPMRAACLLLVDGLGWEALRTHRRIAPFLGALAERGRPIDAGFPATTVASLGSVGTGLPPGGHGLIGDTFRIPGLDRPLNALRWAPVGRGRDVDLRDQVVPEDLQPRPTVFERATGPGMAPVLLGPPDHARSGLTRAALRGGRYRGVFSMGDLAGEAVWALGEEGGARFVYAYHAGLDMVAHVRGVGSESFRLELGHVDRVAEAIADRLPKGAALVVTGDHGLMDVPEDARIDVEDHRELLEGVVMLAGEARARYVHVQPGADADVLATWQEVVGDSMWVLSRDEAIEAGWFGEVRADAVARRIGEVVAAAHGPMGVFQRSLEPFLARMVGHHGSMSPAEELVPLLVFRG